MRNFYERKQKHLYFSVAFAMSVALTPTNAHAVTLEAYPMPQRARLCSKTVSIR